MLKQLVLVVAIFVSLSGVACWATKLNLGTCSLSCGDGTPASTPFSSAAAHGRPGKSGPKGDRGPPGKNACDCPEFQLLEKRVTDLEKVVTALNNDRTTMQSTTTTRQTTVTAGTVPTSIMQNTEEWSRIGKYAYWLSKTKETYWNAKNVCTDFGGRLASAGLQNPDTRKTIYDTIFQPRAKDYVFVGLDDVNREKKWVWSNGLYSTSGNSDWADYEPSGGEEHCAIAWKVKNWQLNDVMCDIAMHFLCEKSVE